MQPETAPEAAATALVLFDFDGTLTDKDCFVDFVKSVTPTWRLWLGQILLVPVLLAYKLGFIGNEKARSCLVRFALSGLSKQYLQAQGERYAEQQIPLFLRRNMLAKLHQYQQQGHRIMVVSASLDFYLQPWCEQAEVELLCSRLKFDGNRCQGEYMGPQCGGDQKAAAVQSVVDTNDFAEVIAFGDTEDDLPMLALADIKFMRGKLVS